MNTARLAKILFIEPVSDPIYSAKALEATTAKYLTGCVCSFIVLRDCLEALTQLEVSSFEMIFVHDNLKHMTATDLVSSLRSLGNPIPVVLVSDESPKTLTMDEVTSYGFLGHVVKPFKATHFCRAIVDCLAYNDLYSQRKHLNTDTVSVQMMQDPFSWASGSDHDYSAGNLVQVGERDAADDEELASVMWT